MKLSELAKKYGYSNNFQRFCDALADGYGRDMVAHFMPGGFPEAEMIQTVLSYAGVCFGHDCPVSGAELPQDAERIMEKGRKRYLSHCEPDGRFRYEDFPPQKKTESVKSTHIPGLFE